MKTALAATAGLAEPDVATPEQPQTATNLNRRTCDHCGQSYEPIQGTQKFCSRKCRWAAFEVYHPRITLPREPVAAVTAAPVPKPAPPAPDPRWRRAGEWLQRRETAAE